MKTKEKIKNKPDKSKDPLKKHGDKLESVTEAREKKDNTRKSEIDDQEKEKEQPKEFWDDARENVSEGAKEVGETVTEYAQIMKENAKNVFKTGSEFTQEMLHKAQEIIDNYQHNREIKQLGDERDKIMIKFGRHMYQTVKSVVTDLPEHFFNDTDVQSLIIEIEEIDRRILEIEGKENKNK
jgi:hypothetical protein